jgi:hypothetical protein
MSLAALALTAHLHVKRPAAVSTKTSRLPYEQSSQEKTKNVKGGRNKSPLFFFENYC